MTSLQKYIKILDLPTLIAEANDYFMAVHPDGTHYKGTVQDLINAMQVHLQDSGPLHDILEQAQVVSDEIEDNRLIIEDAKVEAMNLLTAAISARSELYATVSAGLADSTDGEVFSVQGTGDIAFSFYRRVNGATATYISSVAAASKFDGFFKVQDGKFILIGQDGINEFFKVSPTEIDWVGRAQEVADLIAAKSLTSRVIYTIEGNTLKVSDAEGNVFFEALVSGPNWNGRAQEVADLLAAKIKSKNIYPDLYPGEIIYADIDGNVISRQNLTGYNYIGKISDFSNVGTAPRAHVPADYDQIIIYGQSLSVSGSISTPIDFYDAKTFAGGILTNYDPDTAGAANTYFGSDFIALPTSGTETPGKGIVRIMKDLLRDENKIPIANQTFTPIVNSAGTGGVSWAQLSNPANDEYRRLIESVRRAKDFALAAGKTFNVPALAYLQGEDSQEKDDTVSEHYTKLETLFNSLNSDIKAITSQVNDIQFVVYQIASYSNNAGALTGVPLAQLKIAKEKVNVNFGCAMYQMEYADSLHGTSSTYRIMGAMMGVALKRAIIDGNKMQPIGVDSYVIQKNEANTLWVLKCKMTVPVWPLVFDESVNNLYTTPPAHKGFVIKNGSNVDIVTNATITNGDTVNIFCSQNPTGFTLSYAIGGRASGGNLRDSQGDKITINCEGTTKRVDNWCPIFEMAIV